MEDRRGTRAHSPTKTVLMGLAALFGVVLMSGLNVRAANLADSFDDWSKTGTQGEKGWHNGYYNVTRDPNWLYSLAEFTAFSSQQWINGAWRLDGNAGTAPWTLLGQEETHPNGVNSPPNEEHWPVRRWVSTYAGRVGITWHMRKTNLQGGDPSTGVTGHLFVNGVEFDKQAIAGNDGIGVTRTKGLDVGVGDVIDLALDPHGPLGEADDRFDGSANRLTVFISPSMNGDVNGSGSLDLSDAVYTLNFLFLGGPKPVPIWEVTPPLCLPFERFHDNGDGTVTDSTTGLMWQQETAPGRYNWFEALGAVRK